MGRSSSLATTSCSVLMSDTISSGSRPVTSTFIVRLPLVIGQIDPRRIYFSTLPIMSSSHFCMGDMSLNFSKQ
jgi:hypothetical protein